ncbi:MAG: hypothetical protein Kow0069_37830 [Promethearchaeota archaeon]
MSFRTIFLVAMAVALPLEVADSLRTNGGKRTAQFFLYALGFSTVREAIFARFVQHYFFEGFPLVLPLGWTFAFYAGHRATKGRDVFAGAAIVSATSFCMETAVLYNPVWTFRQEPLPDFVYDTFPLGTGFSNLGLTIGWFWSAVLFLWSYRLFFVEFDRRKLATWLVMLLANVTYEGNYVYMRDVEGVSPFLVVAHLAALAFLAADPTIDVPLRPLLLVFVETTNLSMVFMWVRAGGVYFVLPPAIWTYLELGHVVWFTYWTVYFVRWHLAEKEGALRELTALTELGVA